MSQADIIWTVGLTGLVSGVVVFFLIGRFLPDIVGWIGLVIGTVFLVDYAWPTSFLGIRYSNELTASGVYLSGLDEVVEAGFFGVPTLLGSTASWYWGRVLRRRVSNAD